MEHTKTGKEHAGLYPETHKHKRETTFKVYNVKNEHTIQNGTKETGFYTMLQKGTKKGKRLFFSGNAFFPVPAQSVPSNRLLYRNAKRSRTTTWIRSKGTGNSRRSVKTMNKPYDCRLLLGEFFLFPTPFSSFLLTPTC